MEVVNIAQRKYQEWLTDEGLTKIQGWAMQGLVDEEIAHNMGIATKTLYEWKKKYSEFSEALKKSKEVADFKVVNALYQRAIGLKITEKKTEIENGIVVKETIIEKDVPPDTGACALWLKNRRSDEWRDKIEVKKTEEKLPTVITGGEELEE